MALKIYTAQYAYTGPDRVDITVKGKDLVDKLFAPTWKMVMDAKQGRISTAEYSQMYRQRMLDAYRTNKKSWTDLLTRDEVTFVCFCKPGDFCHRYLLAGYFEKLGAQYCGERDIIPDES